MSDRKPPKSNAERMREYRKRLRQPSVDNPDSRNDFVTQNVTVLVTLVTEIVTLVTEIRDALIVIPPSSGLRPSEEGEGRNVTKTVTRNVTNARNENGARPWTATYTTRPGEIPRCPDCDHLMVNCQCDRTHAPPPPRADLA